jgi:glutamate-1-semialdehyde aminotransferase
MNVFFLNEPPPSSIARDDAKLIGEFHLAALNHGLFFAPRGLLALSTVMSEELITEIVERASRALADVASIAS